MKKLIITVVEDDGGSVNITCKFSPEAKKDEISIRTSIAIAVIEAIKTLGKDIDVKVKRIVPADGADPAHAASPEAKK